MSSASFTEAPTELVDKIFSELQDDKNALRACTQVCKRFLIPSHRHLYSTICLPPPGGTCTKPLRIFQRYPYLGSFVQHLSLSQKIDCSHNLVDDPALPKLLDLLSRVSSLHVDVWFDWDYMYHDTKQAFIRLFSLEALTRITIVSAQRPPFPEGILRLPPSLTHLEFAPHGEENATFLVDTNPLYYGAVPNKPCLTTLRLTHSFYQSTADCILSARFPVNIQSLDTLHVKVEFMLDEHKAAWRIIRPTKMTLRRLEIDMIKPPRDRNPKADPFNLANLPRLCTLVVRFEIVIYLLREYNPVSWLMDLLRTLPEQSTISLIELEIRIDDEERHSINFVLELTRKIHWARLDFLLTQPNLVYLKEVRLRLSPDCAFIGCLLPEASKRGLLSFALD
ncbi:hypothetical protein BDN72DRAFT_961436 [Pluteus cervinus]|uniref:Uncharacterized protein n=1 Tax=Pluteus cervinus TaxID=181527 RepID=A0ACD3AMS1_9AGAR|nr:hypothetical protein BDN72DRAFT_961436 [Pluteus cervinus]